MRFRNPDVTTLMTDWLGCSPKSPVDDDDQKWSTKSITGRTRHNTTNLTEIGRAHV